MLDEKLDGDCMALQYKLPSSSHFPLVQSDSLEHPICSIALEAGPGY